MFVMLIGTRPFAASHDLAIDTAHPDCSSALTRYERERTDAARLAVPLRPGMRPVLFDLREHLTPVEDRVAHAARTDAERAQSILSMVCHRYLDEGEVEHKAADCGGVRSEGELTLASDRWIAHLLAEFGGDALLELAQVVVDRTRAGRRALAPFALPRGLMLAR